MEMSEILEPRVLSKDAMISFGKVVMEHKNQNLIDQRGVADDFLNPVFENLGNFFFDREGWNDSLDNGKVASVSLKCSGNEANAMRGVGMYLAQESLSSSKVGLDSMVNRQTGGVINMKLKEADSILLRLDDYSEKFGADCYIDMIFYWKNGEGCIEQSTEMESGKVLRNKLNTLYNVLNSGRELESVSVTLLKKKIKQ